MKNHHEGAALHEGHEEIIEKLSILFSHKVFEFSFSNLSRLRGQLAFDWWLLKNSAFLFNLWVNVI